MSENCLRKVLFVTASTTGGGAERMLFNIINSLDDDYRVCLVITSKDKIPDNTAVKANVYNLNKDNARNAFRGIMVFIRQFQPDYIFTTSSNVGYMLILAKLFLKGNFKVVIRCAVSPSEIVETTFMKDLLLGYAIKITYNWCDLLIAQTVFMKQDLIRKYGVKTQKIRVIRNIVDRQFVFQESVAFHPKELIMDNFNIVTSGALYSIKGFDLLIEAIAPIIHSNPYIHLWILGQERYEIGYRDFLQQLIDKYEISDNVILLGHKSNPYPYYRNANLFIMSSRKEGFPNVVLESLFLETPVVATDCVDFSGVIYNGVNGYVVTKGNVMALSKGIKDALETKFDMNENGMMNFDYREIFI